MNFLWTKSLWHYFKYISSACYRKQLRLKEEEDAKILRDLHLSDSLLEETSLISKADPKGKITYANSKFLKVAGYTMEEVLGKDHNVVNSGTHSKTVWKDMYNTVVKERKIWHHPCVVNVSKDGELYYVKSWIQGKYDKNGKLIEFISIRHDITDLIKQQQEIDKKNTYLEHAAKILRHDMHSGINTYIPRGVKSLRRRITDEQLEELRIDIPVKMIEEGLKHTQKVYKGVYEFTNLVKQDAKIDLLLLDPRTILEDFLRSTSYGDQVTIGTMPKIEINESLFCTAIDNLIRNGLKYNDSKTKMVMIYYNEKTDEIIVEDNGRGMTQKEFDVLVKPYVRNTKQKESGSGLGLNICISILREHGFTVTCEKVKNPNNGSKIKIKINK